ncbi:MAG: hypothetical protein KF756_13310 [Acidobacteria bacterium]|nr:hypothetical protein [Acidobacteriota bacterium]
MLSTNSILRQGRFRVSQILASSSSHTIYEAQDNLAAKAVLLCENAGLTLFGNSNTKYRGNGILGIADRFNENGRAYLVTEPLATAGPWDLGSDRHNGAEVTKLCERIRPIVDSVAQIRKQFPNAKLIEISPLYFRTGLDGTLKLAFFERGQILGSNPSDSPYLPLEAIWETLDFASQKAITADYNEASLALLDAAPDHRTDLYSIAAVFYYLLSGSAPKSALERLIEIHDSGKDPLTSIDSVNPNVPQKAASELMKMLSLKRELRDDSLEAALMQPAMPTSMPIAVAPPVEVAAPPVENVPQAVESVEHAAEAVSETVEEAPQHIEEVPQSLEEVPEPVEEAPQHVEEAPAPVEETPQHVEAEAAPVAVVSQPVAPVAKTDDLDDLLEIPLAPAVAAVPVSGQFGADLASEDKDTVTAYADEEPVQEAVAEHAMAAEESAEPSQAEFEIAYSNEVVEESAAVAEEPVEEAPEIPEVAEEPVVAFSPSEEVIEEHPEPFIDEVAPSESEPAAEEKAETAVLTHSNVDEPFGGVHTRVETNAYPVVESAASAKRAVKESVEPSFGSAAHSFGAAESESNGSPIKFIGIGAVALIVLAVGIWMLSSMGGSSKPAETQTAPVTATVGSEPSAQPVAETQPAAAEQQAAQESSPVEPEKAAVEPTREAKPRPQIAEAKPAKPEAKPAAAATPAKAKKVSVDDLINDN